MKLLLPIVLAFIGLAGGLTAGHFLRPAEALPAEDAAAGAPADAAAREEHAEAELPPRAADQLRPDGPPPPYDPALKRDYVQLDRQFVVPVVSERSVDALMILSLSVEVEEGLGAEVHAREPKLRDRFLRVLFEHAQSGAFDGVFTAGPAMRDLRGSLREAAQSVLGPGAHDVLVTDIMRQDMQEAR